MFKRHLAKEELLLIDLEADLNLKRNWSFFFQFLLIFINNVLVLSLSQTPNYLGLFSTSILCSLTRVLVMLGWSWLQRPKSLQTFKSLT